MSKRTKRRSLQETYKYYKDTINDTGCKLLTTNKEFLQSVDKAKKDGQWKSYNIILLEVKCRVCDKPYIVKFANFQNSNKCCRICSRAISTSRVRLSMNDLIKAIKDKGLRYIGGKYKNETSPIEVMCHCGNIFQTTYASVRNSSDEVMCKDCNATKLREIYKSDFSDIKKELESYGCKILINEGEFVNVKTKIKFLASCGHIHEATIDSLRSTKYKMCTSCAIAMNSGKNTYNWKGGTYNCEKVKFRKTYEFKEWVKAVYKRDLYTCQICGQVSGNLNAHHLDGYNWAIDKRVDVDNGITLCADCHKEFHVEYGYGDNTKEQFEEFSLISKYKTN